MTPHTTYRFDRLLMAIPKDRRRRAREAINALRLSVSADKLLNLPLPHRAALAAFLRDAASRVQDCADAMSAAGRGIINHARLPSASRAQPSSLAHLRDVLNALADSLLPKSGRPTICDPDVVPPRGAPHLLSENERAGFVRSIHEEIERQAKTARGGRLGAVRAAVIRLGRRRQLDMSRVDIVVRRYRRWKAET